MKLMEEYLQNLDNDIEKDKDVVTKFINAAKEIYDTELRLRDTTDETKTIIDIYMLLRAQETIRITKEVYDKIDSLKSSNVDSPPPGFGNPFKN